MNPELTALVTAIAAGVTAQLLRWWDSRQRRRGRRRTRARDRNT